MLQIGHDTHRLLAEAKQKGWQGEAAGLQDTLVSYVLVRKADQAAATRDVPRAIGLAQSALQQGGG